jgi:hypothetical protein
LPKNYLVLDHLNVKEDEKDAMFRYWYHAFDEWFITQKLHATVLGVRRLGLSKLWWLYYRPAIRTTCQSPAMVAVLMKLEELSTVDVDKEFCGVVLEMAPATVKQKAAVIPVDAPNQSREPTYP